MQNAIACWNSLYLNQYLFQAPAKERAQVTAIASSSQHINLHGEFDFSGDSLKDVLHVDLAALLTFNCEANNGTD